LAAHWKAFWPFGRVDIASDKHADAVNCVVPPIAYSRFSARNIYGPNGEIEGLIDSNWRHPLEMMIAGRAADALYNGIRMEDDRAADGDVKMARNWMRQIGWTDKEAIDRELRLAFLTEIERLAEPRVAGIILDASGTREQDLPEEFHFSKSRLAQIVAQANG
jgi:hypothetical protein